MVTVRLLRLHNFFSPYSDFYVSRCRIEPAKCYTNMEEERGSCVIPASFKNKCRRVRGAFHRQCNRRLAPAHIVMRVARGAH